MGRGIKNKSSFLPEFACRLMEYRDISITSLVMVQQKKKNPRLIDIREVRGGFWVKACVHLDQGYLLLNECSSVFSDKKKRKKTWLIYVALYLGWPFIGSSKSMINSSFSVPCP